MFQKYTQSNGRRPFGISTLIVGFDYDGTPHLYQTDPSGTYHEWKVWCEGRWGREGVLNWMFSGMTQKYVIYLLYKIVSNQAGAIGRSAKTVLEFLEKHYTAELVASNEETIKLAIKALLEVSFNSNYW